MKRQWIPLLALAFVFAVRGTPAGERVVTLPSPNATHPTILIVEAPEPIAAPAAKPMPVVTEMPTIVICEDCAAEKKSRPRRERFTLCDWWQILCACFYRG
jgi:hypothetical protein